MKRSAKLFAITLGLAASWGCLQEAKTSPAKSRSQPQSQSGESNKAFPLGPDELDSTQTAAEGGYDPNPIPRQASEPSRTQNP